VLHPLSDRFKAASVPATVAHTPGAIGAPCRGRVESASKGAQMVFKEPHG
jgi:hypothetical protein